MRWLQALALLCALGCGRSGKIAESDLALLRPEWTIQDFIRAFGQGEGTELNVLVYPAWDSDDQYLVCYAPQSGRLTEVFRVTPGADRSVRVWPR